MGEATLVGRLRDALPGRVEADVPLSTHTTLGVGGPAAALVRAETVADLAAVAGIASETGCGWLIVGRGSNLLVADAGWPGIAVVLGRGFRGVQVDGEIVLAGAAEPMPALAHTVARHRLGGLAFGVAIPGTLGGAVRMNAGAHGRELSEVLDWAEVSRLGRDGAVERWTRDRLQMAYRHSVLPADGVVLRARLRLQRVGPEQLEAAMQEMKRWRRDHQPLSERSCGSVFRNPPDDSAGRLIEAAGLKGLRIGGAQVSPVHANFITVSSGAIAEDVLQVIRTVQAEVASSFGVHLNTEVVLAGFEEHVTPAGRSGS